MIRMIGPGGPDGCSVMNCMHNAAVVLVYNVKHPDTDVYQIEYKFCAEKHQTRRLHPDNYPNFKLVSECIV